MLSYIKLYLMIIIHESRRFFIYRSNLYSGLLRVVFTLVARYALWNALFATGNAQNSSFQETMTFYIINDILLVWIASQYGNSIGEEIRSGDIAQRLVKPYPYHLHLVATFHATSVSATMTRSVPMLLLAFFFVGLLPPVSFAALICFLITAVLSAVIYSLVDLVISYTAFWLTDYWYLQWFKRALFSLFGGLTLPLWFYPGWLRAICDLLPFKYAVFQPMSFYLGRVDVSGIAASLCIQIFWIAILFILERTVWLMTQKKLVVQGG